MDSQSRYKFLSVLFSISLISFAIEANANNWNNSNSKFDLEKLEQIPVPKSFPEHSFRAYEKCKSSKGSEWSNDIEIFVSNDFLWASKHSYQGDWVKVYVGKRTQSGKFIINVSEASKKWKSDSTWMQYELPSSQSVVDSLDSGKISGKKTQGSYWRKCTFTINNVGESNKISLAKFKPINRQSIALNSLISRQEIVLEKLAKLGLRKGEAYDFAHLLNELEASLVKERKRAEAEAARVKAEEEERKRAEAEAARVKAEEEERKRAEAEAARVKAEEEERKRAEAEAARVKAEEEENEEIGRSISSFVEAFKMKKALEETIIQEAEDVSEKALNLEEEIQNWIKGSNFQP